MPGTNERRRLAALKRLNILDTPPEERFERLIRIAKRYYNVDIALFSILDEERQWFKSRDGLDATETPRSMAFCDHAIRQDRAFIIEDATRDPRFRDNPLVTGKPHIRFYAGIPVREPTGFKLGSLCIIDSRPRKITDVDLEVLRNLASLVEDEIERAYYGAADQTNIDVSHLNRAIYRAQNVFLSSDNEHAAFEVLLNDLLTLTGSEFGLISEVLHRPSGDPYLKVGAITNIAWSPATQSLYQQIERRGMTFDRVDNILGLPLVDGEVIISDSVINDPRGKGLPAGHPPVNAYIGMPIHSGDQMIGLVGLANRSGGYTADLAEELDPLLQTIATLIERKRLYREKWGHQKRLEKAANFDSLTGLPNRRRLTELFEDEIREANLREGVIAVCFIDLDGFKDINDTHGHMAGDAVLKSVAQRLQASVREHDVIARLGGDEFVALLRDVEDAGVYQRILDALCKPVSYKSQVLQLSGSMGVTVYPVDDATPDMLLRHADQAMYAAKESGKNCFRVFDMRLHQARKERVRVLEQVDSALESGQFELYYQPVVNFRHRQVIAFEALLRWHHPELGLLTPDRVLPHIEFTDYDRRIGRFVMGQAVNTLREFDRQGLPYGVSINLSPMHFLGDHFADDLGAALQDCKPGLCNRLTVEILETTAMDDPDVAIEAIRACRELGVAVSLDDFGTGYSSLSYFRKLPVDEIKIDRSFVRELAGSSDDNMIVEAIIGLSRSFRRRVVAEGVETPELLGQLLEMGCDIGQGYHFSEPLPLPEALAWAAGFQD